MERLAMIRVFNYDVDEPHRVFIYRRGQPHMLIQMGVLKGAYRWTPWYRRQSQAIVPGYSRWLAPSSTWALCAVNRSDLYWKSDEGGIDVDVRFIWMEDPLTMGSWEDYWDG